MSSPEELIARLSPEKRELLFRRLEQEQKKPGLRGVQPVERTSTSYRLSVAQERMWFLHQLNPTSATYHLPVAFRLRGALDVAILERSLQKVVRRHEIFRVRFVATDGVPAQILVPETRASLTQVDLSAVPAERRAESLDAAIVQHVKQPFNLEEDLLLRVVLFRLSEAEHVLLIVTHHISSDAWSCMLLGRELATCYAALVRQERPALPELPYQYIDFAAWQRQYLESEALAPKLDYWREALGSELPVLELPADGEPVPAATRRGGVYDYEASPALHDALRRLCRQERVTLNMALLAGFYALLHRQTGQEEIVVGAPVAGRQQAGSDQLIGCFINTLLLQTHVASSEAYRSLLHRVRSVSLSADSHQDVPIEWILNELNLERRHHGAEPFKVLFNMFSWQDAPIHLPEIEVELLPFHDHDPKFDLTLYVSDQAERLSFRFVYDASIYSAARMEDLVHQYAALLEAVVFDPDLPIGRISLRTDSAARKLPDPTRPIEAHWPEAVDILFSRQATARPEQVAIRGDDGSAYTYGHLERRANQLASHLRSAGISEGDIVAIYAARSPSLVWALLGILKAGAAFTILDPAYPASRLDAQCRKASIKGLVQVEDAGPVPAELERFLSKRPLAVRLSLPSLNAACAAVDAASEVAPERSISPNDVAYVAFTSGSTGEPKGIVGTHGPLSHFIDWHHRTFALSSQDRFSMLSGLAHDPLLRDVFTPLTTGATLCVPNPDCFSIPGALADWIRRQEITVLHLTPPMVQLLADEDAGSEDRLERLRYAFFGGDLLKPHHVALLRSLAPGVTCVNFYGATETPQGIAYHIVPQTDEARSAQSIPLGRGIDGVQLLVINEAGTLAGVGEPGEICIRTPYLASGYLNDDALTASRFQTNPFTDDPADRLYRSGDLGRYRPDGSVEFAGRADTQVKVRGYRIETEEVERVLAQHPRVRQVVVIAQPDTLGEQCLVAYVVPSDDDTLSPAELRNHVGASLPDYMVPSRFVPIDVIPLTPNGKIDRRALPPADNVSVFTAQEYAPPRTRIEERLVRIWSTLLNVESIGIHDNFFDLGGQSLLSVKLVAQIQNEFGIQLPVSTIFLSPTVAELAPHVASQASSANRPERGPRIVPLRVTGHLPPLFCFHGMGTDVVHYMPLIKRLRDDRPVYGLVRPQNEAEHTEGGSVMQWADEYVEEILQKQPEGPYYLLGYCLAGIVAVAVASRLIERGHDVAFLGAIDTTHPTGRAVTPETRKMHVNRLVDRLRDGDIAWFMGVTRGVLAGHTRQVRSRLARLLIKAGVRVPLSYSLDALYHTRRRIIRSASDVMYPGQLTLFNSRMLDTDRGWGPYARTIEIEPLPGRHLELIREPGVENLGEAVQRHLDAESDPLNLTERGSSRTSDFALME